MFQVICTVLAKRFTEPILSHLTDECFIAVLIDQSPKRSLKQIPKRHIAVIVQTTGGQCPISQDPHHFESAVTMPVIPDIRVV